MLVRRLWPSEVSWSDGLTELEQMRRDMERLFESFAAPAGAGWAGVFPLLNVTQDDDRYYVRAVVPGMRASDLSISAHGRRLTISGKREHPAPSGEASYHRQERGEGTFSRALELPGDVEVSRVEASYADGIVTVRLPKAESEKPRQITVKTA